MIFEQIEGSEWLILKRASVIADILVGTSSKMSI